MNGYNKVQIIFLMLSKFLSFIVLLFSLVVVFYILEIKTLISINMPILYLFIGRNLAS